MFTSTEHVSPPIQKKPRTEGGKERGTTRIQTQALPLQRSFPYCPYAVSEKLVLSQVRERVRVQESLGGGGEGGARGPRAGWRPTTELGESGEE